MNQDLSLLEPGYTVAFFDIDGTLTPRAADTHNGNIPPSGRVQEAIRAYVSAGNVAFVSTGRGPAGINDSLMAMPFAGYLALGGAYSVLNDEAVFDEKIPEDIIRALMEFMFAEHLSASFDSTGTPTIIQGGDALFRGAGTKGWDGMSLFTTLDEALGSGVAARISKVNMEEETWRVVEERFPFLDSVEHFFAGKNSHELTAKGITKASGALALLEALPEGRGEVLVFGDSDNDVAVLDLADISVVMGTAPDHLKQGATYVTGSVAEEGVATALEALRQIWY